VFGYNNGVGAYRHEDSCIDTTNLYEYFCRGTSWYGTSYNCKSLGLSYSCDGGKCVGAGGKGGGCPILKVWDGENFVEIEKLNIHAPEGQDVTVNSSFTMQSVDGKYEIILHEAAYLFWDGSHIDSVKLVDETGKECRLISAVHSEVGDVLQQLTESDDVRARTFPGEEIKLTYDGCSGNIFTFSIEGYNMKVVGLDLNSSNIVVIIITLISISVLLFIFSLIPRLLYKESKDFNS
jgi:hypothetical protein